MASSTPPPGLLRALGDRDIALITIGGILGSAIFIAAADVPRAVPHPLLVLLLWTAGGLVSIAGALTYAELGAMFPRAGGQYQYLKEAYGPLWGFLFGWAAFLVVMSGGIASLAVAFGEYLGSFVPFFSNTNVVAAAGGWRMTGGQVAAVLAISGLTAINYVGLKEGAGLQNVVTLAKVGALLAIAGLGLLLPSANRTDWTPAVTATTTASALGVGMIAVFWGYDGWYNATFVAGETRDPGRNLPRGLIAGTIAVTVLYVVTNAVYFRVLSMEAIVASPRIGEAAGAALFGSIGGRLIGAAVVVSTFGCVSATILACARIYQPMAEDGVFFAALARVHPRYHTPGASLIAQGAWSVVLACSGTYEQLYTYAVFAAFVFHTATALAVIRLRRTRPLAARPYRTWGYPWVPIVFATASIAFVANTLMERPMESFLGLGLVALGLPAYAWWRRKR
jgi:basic amino acid/polyamine antiporter, APA family